MKNRKITKILQVTHCTCLHVAPGSALPNTKHGSARLRWPFNKYFHEFFPSCHVLQPAESECLAETASSRAALTWTARGFASAYRTPTDAPAPAAGSGAAARRVSLHSPLQNRFSELLSRFCQLPQLCSPSPACHNDMYGPDCKFSCNCQNGGVCNRFSGCHCPPGWRGRSCQKPGTTETTSL